MAPFRTIQNVDSRRDVDAVTSHYHTLFMAGSRTTQKKGMTNVRFKVAHNQTLNCITRDIECNMLRHGRQFSIVTARVNLFSFIPLIHGIAVLCYFYGLVLRSKFHNGMECDMTWSVVNFIHIPMVLSTGDTGTGTGTGVGGEVEAEERDNYEGLVRQKLPYRLMKFIDGRDERYTYLIDRDRPLDDGTSKTFHVVEEEDWCRSGNFDEGIEDLAPHGHIVLYIPGHEGQFHQARSLAAHGLNITRQAKFIPREIVTNTVEYLWDGTMNARAKYVDHFVYDVFTVDFYGEGGGYHGSKLFAQVEFVMQAMEQIAYQCDETHITVVAHSIGGLVARMAALKLNEQKMREDKEPLVRTIFTLASPHASVPLVMDESVHKFHHHLRALETSFREMHQKMDSSGAGETEAYFPIEVSISGGLRDELIPQSACHRDDHRALSLMATDISAPRIEMEYTGRRFGMDHKAIVWCNGLLSTVREMIHVAATASLFHDDGVYSTRSIRMERIAHLVDSKRRSLGITLADPCEFDCQVQEKEQLLVEEYGIVGSFALQASMLYNLRSVALLYFMDGLLYFFFQTWGSWSKPKNLDSLYFFVIPILSSLAMFCVFSGQVDLLTSIVLAYVAMTIYYIILCKAIPWTMFLARKLLRKEGSFLLVPHLTPTIRGQLNCALSISFVGCLLLSIFAWMSYPSTVVLNPITLGAFLFLISILFIGLNIINLVCDAETEHCRELDPRRCTLAAILIIAWPLVALGKVIFAISLLAQEGQIKALPYMQYEQNEWDQSYLGKKHGMLSGVAGYLLKYDLPRFTTTISIPVYAAVVWMSCRRNISYKEGGQEVKKRR